MKIDIRQLEFIDSTLREIMIFVEDDTGLEFTITSLYRIGDKGVHGALPLRGGDLRIRNKNIGKIVAATVNLLWQYDDKRPNLKCAIIHGQGANLHLHLQVHPNTRSL